MGGVTQLRQSFNAVSSPRYECTLALMDTHRAHDVEFQVLTFVVTSADGVASSVVSRHIRPGEDVNAVAAETAETLVKGNMQ
jgi:hypothetical protein